MLSAVTRTPQMNSPEQCPHGLVEHLFYYAGLTLRLPLDAYRLQAFTWGCGVRAPVEVLLAVAIFPYALGSWLRHKSQRTA